MGCDLRGCADSAGVSDTLTTGTFRSHNPLVLGSNPSGPTNQPIEAPVVRKIDATDHRGLIRQLKLFSQLFETVIVTSRIVRAQNRWQSFCQDWNGRCFESMGYRHGGETVAAEKKSILPLQAMGKATKSPNLRRSVQITTLYAIPAANEVFHCRFRWFRSDFWSQARRSIGIGIFNVAAFAIPGRGRCSPAQ
jgi:hypothetical protein